MSAIWWIRRDLRLTDNAALTAALRTGPVFPVFIIDPVFASSSPRRRNFLFEGLHALDNDLRARNSYLIVRTGKPAQVLQKLLYETHVDSIYAEEDFTPYALRRDREVARRVPLQLIHGQTAHHPTGILKADGKPYRVFTAYAKAWKAKLPPRLTLHSAPEIIHTPAGVRSEPLPGFKVSPLFPAGEEEALVRLEEFFHRRIHRYHEHRDRMDLEGTSALSPYLHFGMLGLRQVVHAAQQAIAEKKDIGAETWLNELIWREFYIQILYHFPHIRRAAYNSSLANIPWRNDPVEFNAWKDGRTGVPIVDAAMRQLKKIGWMHNRARMIATSYLVKDLLIF